MSIQQHACREAEGCLRKLTELIVRGVAEGRVVVVVSIPQGVAGEGLGVADGGSPLVLARVNTDRDALAHRLLDEEVS